MRTIAICVVMLLGCGKSDDCEKLVDRMMSAALDKKPKDFDRDKAVAECRKNIDKIKSDPTAKCVLEAKSDSDAKDCITKGVGEFKAKSERTEAKLMLNKIGKRAKMYFVEKAEFPKGKAKMLPEKSCCPDKCAVTTEWAKDPVWQQLDFSIDEPNRFQYGYESADGKTFKAIAVGDLDCDAHTETFTLDGKSDGGNPSVTLSEPAKGP